MDSSNLQLWDPLSGRVTDIRDISCQLREVRPSAMRSVPFALFFGDFFELPSSCLWQEEGLSSLSLYRILMPNIWTFVPNLSLDAGARVLGAKRYYEKYRVKSQRSLSLVLL